MKITAGLGSADEYIRFVEAGADEFFSGFVPYSWTEKYGTVMYCVIMCNLGRSVNWKFCQK